MTMEDNKDDVDRSVYLLNVLWEYVYICMYMSGRAVTSVFTIWVSLQGSPYIYMVTRWVKNLLAIQETQEKWVWSLSQRSPWRRVWQPTPVFLPGESHGQRSLAGYSPWGRQESDRTDWLTHTHTHTHTPVQFSSVAQSCPTLCDPMNCSTSGLPVRHQLLEFTQTPVHWVGDAIQPSHPLSSLILLPPVPPSIRDFSNESCLRMRWPKYWSFSFSRSPSNEHSGLISFRMDWYIHTKRLKIFTFLKLNSKREIWLGLEGSSIIENFFI